MAVTVSDVCNEARDVYLNDTELDVFTNTVLIPFVKKAYDELQNKLAVNGFQVNQEVSSVIEVPANTLVLPSLPADLIEPIALYERADGSVSEDDWVEMTKQRILKNESQKERLEVWDWRENEIKLRGATIAREVKLTYIKFLASIVDANSQIPIINCKPYLSARVAALAAYHIGGNAERSAVANLDAGAALDDILGINTKGDQNTPVRRKPFRFRGRR